MTKLLKTVFVEILLIYFLDDFAIAITEFSKEISRSFTENYLHWQLLQSDFHEIFYNFSL